MLLRTLAYAYKLNCHLGADLLTLLQNFGSEFICLISGRHKDFTSEFLIKRMPATLHPPNYDFPTISVPFIFRSLG